MLDQMKSGPEGIKLFSCSPQLSMKIQMLISVKNQEIKHFLGSDKARMLFFLLIKLKCQQLLAFQQLCAGKISCSAELSMKKSCITSGPDVMKLSCPLNSTTSPR